MLVFINVGMDMKSKYLNYPDIQIYKSEFEFNSYPDLPNYPDYPYL